MTINDKAVNLISPASGVSGIGLSAYEWWSEGLHGVADSPGVQFQTPNGSDFSYATSFPLPILMGASFDDDLIRNVASVIGKEARAFANAQKAGFDYWTPNINGFLDPRWGRGLETPGEDIFHIQNYVKQLVPAFQGVDNKEDLKQIIATCKHYAVYDVETNRNGQNYDVTQQDLGDYYLPAFKTCARDALATSIMCSYNAVDGVPSCASEYLLQMVLRDTWGFTAADNYVVSDCDAVSNIWDPHGFTTDVDSAAAVALNAGTDLNCNGAYKNLVDSVAENMTTESAMDQSLTRLYHALFSVGYFDGAPDWDGFSWADVSTSDAQTLAYEAAVEGITLLKNDGLLPLRSDTYSSVALIGPWANATSQMQGNYYGVAPYLISPLEAFQASFDKVQYAEGTAISGTNDTGFSEALSAAKSSDAIFYMGGIDTTVEAEGMDRTSIEWPGNQLDLISQLGALGKPLVVVQFGGGQVDDTVLLQNSSVNAVVWAGYPGQNGGNAVCDVLTGKKAAAGRLPVTQYSADYTNEASIFDPTIRPNTSFPGRTYRWYTGEPVLPFGYGLHYTNFSLSWETQPQSTYSIQNLVDSGGDGSDYLDLVPFVNVSVTVKNAGGPANVASDYVGLLFLSSSNAGPEPRPNKTLVSYSRAHDIPVDESQVLSLPVTLGSLARADENGDLTIYPGDYIFSLDTDAKLSVEFQLTGDSAIIDTIPRQAAQYNYTVPVYPQA
jgi:beta-D-xylosidase 4